MSVMDQFIDIQSIKQNVYSRTVHYVADDEKTMMEIERKRFCNWYEFSEKGVIR